MSNPLISDSFFQKTSKEVDSTIEGIRDNEIMTLDGTINKSAVLIILTIVAATLVWKFALIVVPFYLPICIITFILTLIIAFYKQSAPYLAPIYAILEGIAIGAISALLEAYYPGIVIQAIGLTFGVFVMMLFLYKSNVIKPTEKFKKGIIAATGAICLVYLVDFILIFFFSTNVPFIHETGPIGIGISLVIVGIATLNLILDFENIRVGAEYKLPKYYEWFVSFGLLVTLIWLYFEILRLLTKIKDR